MVSTHSSDPWSIAFRRCADELQQQGVAALAELFDLTAPRLVRYAAALTRERHDAEDAMQAAFVQVAKHPEALGESRHPWPYLLRIVRNEALRIVRQRRPPPVFRDPTSGGEIEDDRQETAEAVRTALARLPIEQAEVVALKVWENMTFAQIGVVMGTSPNTASTRYQSALEKLERLLRPCGEEALRVR
jgi:RNA polymerase sigma-70 factor (ECF subfamily)